MLSNTLRLNLNNFRVIHILNPRYHPNIMGHIPKNEDEMKNRSHRYDKNRPRSRHKYRNKYKYST